MAMAMHILLATAGIHIVATAACNIQVGYGQLHGINVGHGQSALLKSGVGHDQLLSFTMPGETAVGHDQLPSMVGCSSCSTYRPRGG